MGLDTTHDCWHGAYSAFTRWRNKLAEVAGYNIVSDDSGYPCADLDWGALETAEGDGIYNGDWTATPDDPLVVLLTHSDCDGVIHPEQAGPLADRLAGLLPNLPDGAEPGHIRDWHQTTQRFIDGLRRAAALKEDVMFR